MGMSSRPCSQRRVVGSEGCWQILLVLLEIAHKKLRKIIVLSSMPHHPTPTKSSTYPCSGLEQNHPGQTKAGMRERERSSGPETDPKVFWLITILRRYALVGRRPTTTPLWGEIPRREANETYALLGRCGSFRGVRHPECLRLRRTGGRLPGGPSARQARGGRGH